MGLAGSEYGLFLKQLSAGHLGLALTYAAGIKIDLADALRLCQLMAREGDERFPRAASRWLERLSAEGGYGLPEVQLGAAALRKLWKAPDDTPDTCSMRRLAACDGRRRGRFGVRSRS